MIEIMQFENNMLRLIYMFFLAHADGSKQPPSRKGEVAAHVRRCMQPPQKRQHEFATAEKQHECHAPGMRAKARRNHADNAPPSRPRTAPAKAGTRHVAPRPLRRRSPDEVQGPHTHPASKSRIGGAASASVIGDIYIYAQMRVCASMCARVLSINNVGTMHFFCISLFCSDYIFPPLAPLPRPD